MVPELARRRFMIVPALIDERWAGMLYYVLLLRNWRGEAKRDRQSPMADSHWGDATLDATLLALKSGIEQVCGCWLLPTYAYARLYFHGDDLARHRDRAACQIAATIHLGSSDGHAPPIWFEPDVAVAQRPGDAVVYLGDSIDHWREPFGGENFGQLFLNYVFADGERAGLLHDGRRNAFPPSLSPRPAAAMPGCVR
ncbi:hypothetical protein ACNRDG_10725 [Ralstonia pseudosolanacearum]|uniref:hypothetical protein n=1 Tax=Ralstonia pseudosolanacearum TaxID=1310165 RepID=UPI003AADB702